MPSKNQNECLACLTPQQRKFAEKHWEKLVALHPGYESSDWTEEECRWWTSYYQADSSRLDDMKSSREYLPPTLKDKPSNEPQPDEMLMRAEAARENTEDDEAPGESLIEGFLDRAVDELRNVVQEERTAGHLTPAQATALKWVLLLLSKPSKNQNLETALNYGRFNVNALVVQINRRARKRIVSHKTLARALDVVCRSIRKRTGKSGYIGSYKTKSPARPKTSKASSHHEALPAQRVAAASQPKTRRSTAKLNGGVG